MLESFEVCGWYNKPLKISMIADEDNKNHSKRVIKNRYCSLLKRAVIVGKVDDFGDMIRFFRQCASGKRAFDKGLVDLISDLSFSVCFERDGAFYEYSAFLKKDDTSFLNIREVLSKVTDTEIVLNISGEMRTYLEGLFVFEKECKGVGDYVLISEQPKNPLEVLNNTEGQIWMITKKVKISSRKVSRDDEIWLVDTSMKGKEFLISVANFKDASEFDDLVVEIAKGRFVEMRFEMDLNGL